MALLKSVFVGHEVVVHWLGPLPVTQEAAGSTPLASAISRPFRERGIREHSDAAAFRVL